jgi:hypothetical protein
MILPSNRVLAVALSLLFFGCSLLQDLGSLSSGYRERTAGGGTSAGGASAGTSGASGSNASGGGAACEPTGVDTACDGLDQDCQPTVQEAVCPAGCKGVAFEGRSYMGCAVSASFNDAEILCQKQRMHLVEIDSASENNFVVQIAQTLGSYVWIGGSDLELNATFAWISGAAFFEDNAPVPGVYQNFAPGQPVSTAGFDCVQLHDAAAGPWSNARCADAKQFVCERP